jgi:hypothetical protein
MTGTVEWSDGPARYAGDQSQNECERVQTSDEADGANDGLT